MKHSNILLTLTVLISITLRSNLYAAGYIGKVIMVKGKATMLLPGDRQASKVKRNMRIKADTSIRTADKSFVKIMMDNRSSMVIGPKSKLIIVEFKKKKAGVVSLLTGKLRAKVKKSVSSNNTKLYVRTKTAAMGVRGTEFQAIYNHKNKITSLVTFSGKVAMAKMEEKKPVTIEKKREMAKKHPKAPKIVAKKVNLEKLLSSKKAVMVKKGRYAGVSRTLKKATAPVKISPKQFTVLKLNKNMDEDAPPPTKKVLAKEIKKTKKEFAKLDDSKDKDNIKQKEGSFNTKTGSYKPKSGGFIDLASGVYVPPSKNSKFDKKTKVFVSTKEIGSVDDTGKYIAPKGLILDAKKGFITEEDSDKGKSEVKLAKLNQNIAAQIVIPKIPKSDLDLDDDEDAYDKYFIISD